MNETTTPRPARIDPDASVNEVLCAHPEAAAVFNAFGVDACCGGAAALADAAREAGLEPTVLLEALEGAVSGAATERAR